VILLFGPNPFQNTQQIQNAVIQKKDLKLLDINNSRNGSVILAVKKLGGEEEVKKKEEEEKKKKEIVVPAEMVNDNLNLYDQNIGKKKCNTKNEGIGKGNKKNKGKRK
jgi:hypothetical protein